MFIDSSKCVKCKKCVPYCPRNAILEKDGDKLQQVVAYLMEHETMTGAQFADLMEGRELSEASATALTDGYGEEESE